MPANPEPCVRPCVNVRTRSGRPDRRDLRREPAVRAAPCATGADAGRTNLASRGGRPVRMPPGPARRVTTGPDRTTHRTATMAGDHEHRTGTERIGRARQYELTAAELGAIGGQTLVAALLPVLLSRHTDSVLAIGAVVASEGAFAILVPYVIGALSDSLPSRLAQRFGRRTFFLLAAAPVMAGALIVLPFRDRFWTLAASAMVFFAALHSFKTPLRALVIESVPHERWGRVQGALGSVHAAGVAYGLVAGGLLFAVWQPLPFLIAAALVLGTLAVTYHAAPEADHTRGTIAANGRGGPGRDARSAADGRSAGDGSDGRTERTEGDGPHAANEGPGDHGHRAGAEVAFLRDLLGRDRTRWYLTANVLWNAGTEGVRPYIFLFATIVLGITVDRAALVIGSLLAGVGIGSFLVGWLGDRFGRQRVLLWGVLIAGMAMVPGVWVRTVPAAVAFLVPAGLGAASLTALPYPVFAQIAGEPSIGRATGVFNLSTGAARLVAPLLIGAAIDLGRRTFPAQAGYPAMWPVAGLLVMLGAAALVQARRSSAAEAGEN